MPAVRRWRLLFISLVFIGISFHYLANRRNTWNYGYTPYVTTTPVEPIHEKVHWRPLPERFPVETCIPLPNGKPADIPRVQAPPPREDAKQKRERLRRRDAVKESFVHSWTGYKQHAWLQDEVTPITRQYKNTFGGWAATLVDSLDTLWILGLERDFEEAVAAAETIDFTTTQGDTINVFETTIRYLGGFLAAYDISEAKYPVLLKKAEEVGELLMSCFDTRNRMPISRWDWKHYSKGRSQRVPSRMLVSELGSMSLEFTRLSQLTGNPKYYDAVQRISNELEKSQNNTKLPGMWPVSINAGKLDFSQDNFFTLGGMSDSLYEYLPKQYLMLGGLLDQPKALYERFIEVAKEHLFFRIYNSANERLTLSGDVRVKPGGTIIPIPSSQHLACFTGGMVALASKIFSRPEDLTLASELTAGCVWAYDSNKNGIAPEIFTVIPCPKQGACKWDKEIWYSAVAEIYNRPTHSETELEVNARAKYAIQIRRLPPGFTAIDDLRYILRPEAIESVFIMYRITGEQKWADAAWRMFLAIEKVSRTDVAAAAIRDITAEMPVKVDSMESFWLAETLKYFYLCFDEWDAVSLDEWVLNTEAHPLRRPREQVEDEERI